MKLLYEGKAKRIYEDTPQTVIMEFKDSLTAFNAQKLGSFSGKGSLNLRFAEKIFSELKSWGVDSHFVEVLDSQRVRVKKLQMLPVEVVVRNRIAGSLASRLGLPEGKTLSRPLVEFYLKNDKLGDPLITDEQVLVLGFLTSEQWNRCREIALQVNQGLLALFSRAGVDLADFKIEIGQDPQGRFLLADEITPDSCRLWDQATGEKLDKDVFRRDLGDVGAAYRKIAKRLGLEGEGT